MHSAVAVCFLGFTGIAGVRPWPSGVVAIGKAPPTIGTPPRISTNPSPSAFLTTGVTLSPLGQPQAQIDIVRPARVHRGDLSQRETARANVDTKPNFTSCVLNTSSLYLDRIDIRLDMSIDAAAFCHSLRYFHLRGGYGWVCPIF